MVQVTPKEAAKLLNCDVRWVYDACEQGILGFSVRHGKRRTPHISAGALASWCGWTIEQLERELERIRK